MCDGRLVFSDETVDAYDTYDRNSGNEIWRTQDRRWSPNNETTHLYRNSASGVRDCVARQQDTLRQRQTVSSQPFDGD